MKFSLNFLREIIDCQKPAREIAELFTMAGMEVEKVYQEGKDWVFDAEITTNRTDWLSIVGIGRELAAILEEKWKLPELSPMNNPEIKDINILIENKKDCFVYLARRVENVRIKESPAWLRQRINNCGISSVNNLVDVTNYCMLKWGNPLHVFDLDKIEGDIYVRRAHNKEKFLGLDNKERPLCPDNLVIADEKKVIALAGIIGAKNTEVNEGTRRVLVEAAVFSPALIRKSKRAAGLDTESSYRFERMVSSFYLDNASSEAVQLIELLGGGRFSGYKKRGREEKIKQRTINIKFSSLNQYLGTEISPGKIKKTIKSLGFPFKEDSKEGLFVFSDQHRPDIIREVDIYEEVARIYGYNEIEPRIPLISANRQSKEPGFKSRLRDLLISMGLKEIITYSITGEEILSKLKSQEYIIIDNPLRAQENVLRPTLLPGALEVVKHNLNQKNGGVKVFELAKRYRKSKGGPGFRENNVLAITVSAKENKVFYLKGIVEKILAFSGMEKIVLREKELDNFVNALEIYEGKELIGFMGKVDKKIQTDFGLKEQVFFSEIDFDAVYNLKKEKFFVPFSRFPFVTRDISVCLHEDVRFSRVEKIIKEGTGEFFKDAEVIDVYEGPDITSGNRAFTVRIYYQSEDRTLTSREVDDIHNRVRNIIAATEGIFLR